MSDSMSTPATHALEAAPDAVPATAGPGAMGAAAANLSLEAAFDVDRTAEIILEGGYKTIGLQFPDELLPSSVAVFRALQSRVSPAGAQCYVLADSTYGACCPDVLSCLHLPADLLVHYGHACLTPTDALPVHYVFPRFPLDVSAALGALRDKTEWEGVEGAIVVWDVGYDWLADEIETTFAKADKPVSFARIRRPEMRKKKDTTEIAGTGRVEKKAENGCCADEGCTPTPCSKADTTSTCCTPKEPAGSCCGQETVTSCCKEAPSSCSTSRPTPSTPSSPSPALRTISPPPGVDPASCAIWYLGAEGRSLLNLQMTHSSNALYAYDPDSGARECTGASRLLSRRLFAVHQALAADVFGLVVGNIGLASSKPLLAELRGQLAARGKKSYTLSVGRLNPAKLANFADIECFVLVGCAEGGVVDSKDFLRPIITPYELTLALSGAEWDPAKWTLDLGTVLDAAREGEAKEPQGEESDEELEFSLVTGTYRSRKVFNPATPAAKAAEAADGVRDLTLRGDFTVATLESAGSMFLASRSFQGLEPRYGLDEPAVLEQGRSGIARGYTEEK